MSAMRTLVVGVGNTLRGDDGVGPFVIDLLRACGAEDLDLRTVHALLPELAADLPGHDAVVFVDADVRATAVTLRPLQAEGREGIHRLAPERVVRLARRLGFHGQAWTCSVPVQTMEPGERLSSKATIAAGRAATVLLGGQWRHAERAS
jgi:hydrogenase maturation protease